MKLQEIAAITGILIFALLVAGCASTSPAVPVQTPVPTTVVITSPTPVVTLPYPNALTLNQYATFGSGKSTGKAMVYQYLIRPNYTWTEPTFNSPHQVEIYSPPYNTQYGYNIEEPAAGNVFMFVYLHVVDTGTTAVYTASAKQFTLNYNGVIYPYKALDSPDVVVNGITGKQYDFNFGPGGTVGYVQPGDSNAADGYLIYEVPGNFVPEKTFVMGNLDYQTQAVWRLGSA